MPAGERSWRVELADGRVIEHTITVPGASYDIEI
jgi:hypothetical protein